MKLHQSSSLIGVVSTFIIASFFVPASQAFWIWEADESDEVSNVFTPRRFDLPKPGQVFNEIPSVHSQTDPKIQSGAEMYGEIPNDFITKQPMYVCATKKNKPLPDEYDARSRVECPSISQVRHEGPSCSSSWAIAVASVLTDRYCFQTKKTRHSKERVEFIFSDYDLVACGENYTAWDQDESIKGCYGGNVMKAWKYVEENGLVSGGHFSSQVGCRPSEIDPFNKEIQWETTPTCNKQCESNYNGTYDTEREARRKELVKKDGPKIGRGLSCRLEPGNVLGIQREIQQNGPVVAHFFVCEDLDRHDFEKVYRRKEKNTEKCNKHQAVRIVGWGSQDEKNDYGIVVPVDYWIVANSLGRNWGAGGFFKVLRQPKKCWENGCIEMNVSAPNFNFNPRILYTGPMPLADVDAGKSPRRSQDFHYIGQH